MGGGTPPPPPAPGGHGMRTGSMNDLDRKNAIEVMELSDMHHPSCKLSQSRQGSFDDDADEVSFSNTRITRNTRAKLKNYYRWTTAPRCMTCLRTRIIHITPITLIRGWVTVIPAAPLSAAHPWADRRAGEGIPTYPTPFYPPRPTGPPRLWSSLLSI